MRERILTIPLVLAILVSACGGPDAPPPDPATDVPPATDQPTTPAATTLPSSPGGAVQLRAMGGSGVTGEAHLSGTEGRSGLHIMVRGAEPGVRLQPNLVTGTCDDLGGGVADLDPFFVDDTGSGSGMVTASVPLGAGGHSLVIHQPERQPNPVVACGEIGAGAPAGTP